MKKLISFALTVATVLCLFVVCTATCSALEPVAGPDVRVNGRLVDFPDEKPFIKDGRTYIPVRFVAEALGADVSWSHEIQGAVIKKGDLELQLPIGSKVMTVIENSKTSTVTMDAAAEKQNGRTLIPIRFVAEAMGAWVSFSTAYNTVQIYNDVLTPKEIEELHALKNHRDVCAERKHLTTGNSPYENLNECAIRDFTSAIDYTITNVYTGDTYTNGKDPLEDKALLVADYIRHGIAEAYTNEFLGTKATFRTDISCLAASTTSTQSTYINRGYLTITFEEDADIDEFLLRKSRQDFGNIKAGGTYTYTIESVWMINIASGRPLRMNEYNVTNGIYDRWS